MLLSGTSLPRSWEKCFITTFYKGKGDSALIENRRPIALLNSDYKIFSGIITRKLYTMIAPLISPLQNGFVPGRIIHSNVFAVSEILYDMQFHPSLVTCFLNFYDFKKAFDSVS